MRICLRCILVRFSNCQSPDMVAELQTFGVTYKQSHSIRFHYRSDHQRHTRKSRPGFTHGCLYMFWITTSRYRAANHRISPCQWKNNNCLRVVRYKDGDAVLGHHALDHGSLLIRTDEVIHLNFLNNVQKHAVANHRSTSQNWCKQGANWIHHDLKYHRSDAFPEIIRLIPFWG